MNRGTTVLPGIGRDKKKGSCFKRKKESTWVFWLPADERPSLSQDPTVGLIFRSWCLKLGPEDMCRERFKLYGICTRFQLSVLG